MVTQPGHMTESALKYSLLHAKLERLEAVISRGLETFVEVGNALAEIRDQRLYRESHATFEDYCRERWGWSRVHAHRTIQAAEVAGVLLPTGNTPTSERVARELAPLIEQPEQLREAWQEAVEQHETPTAAEVREVVRQKTYTPKPIPPTTQDDLWRAIENSLLDIEAVIKEMRYRKHPATQALQDGLVTYATVVRNAKR